MRIQINGKQIDVGAALTEHVEKNLEGSVGKYSEQPIDANVTFSKDSHEFICDISVHLSTGLNAQAKGRAGDVYDSFEGAVSRLETQLRRYKRRLKGHHKERKSPIEALGVPSYVLAGNSDAEEPETLQPIIVAEMETQVQSLSVGEAVMQMELSGLNMLVFRNTTHEIGRAHV